MQRNTASVVIFLLLISLDLFAQDSIGQYLQNYVRSLSASEALNGASIGMTVIDVEDGTLISAFDEHRKLTPASTLKVLATSTALHLFGDTFRYRTHCFLLGKPNDSVFVGDLLIKGSGDPSFFSKYFSNRSDAFFQSIVDSLEKYGVKHIDGRIVLDTRIFNDELIPDTWIWQDIGNYYGAGTCGINYLDNACEVSFRTGSTGSKTMVVGVKPANSDIVFNNEVIAKGSGDHAFIYGPPFIYERSIRGTLPPNRSLYTIKGSLPDPAMQLGKDLLEYLEKHGVTVKRALKRLKYNEKYEYASSSPFYSYASPSLDSIIYYTNLKSDNVYAETLLKTLGAYKGGDGSIETGLKVMLSYWEGQGLDLSNAQLFDGSGLSKANAISTYQLASVLYRTYSSNAYNAFNRSLPVAGRSGSMRRLLRGTVAENNMRAKTGYLNEARSYAGYVKSLNGRTYAFSLIANNYNCSATEMKKMLEQVMLRIAKL